MHSFVDPRGIDAEQRGDDMLRHPLDQNRNRNSELFLRGQRSAVFLDIAHVALSQSALVSPVAVN